MDPLARYLDALPLVAILRGVRPQEIVEIGTTLVDHGLRCIEIPLNSPDPYASIAKLAGAAGDEVLIGAGTVLDVDAVARVAAAGGRLIVSPNFAPAVVEAAVAGDLISLPGVATPSEAFAALAAGAHGLKVFPAEALPPAVVKAWCAVLPAGVRLMPVGGIAPGSMAAYVAAGAAGFGLGSALYRPGFTAAEVAERAAAFASAWAALSG